MVCFIQLPEPLQEQFLPCAIKKDRNVLCVSEKVQRSSALLLQLFCALYATAVSLGSNAVKLHV